MVKSFSSQVIRKLCPIVVCTFVLAACSSKSSSTKLNVTFPTSASGMASTKGQAGLTAMSTVNTDLFCYAVNVMGSGIQGSSPTCEFQRGVVAGSVTGGSSLSIEVTEGLRTVEIYGFLRSSTMEVCPLLTPNSRAWASNKTYRLFKVENFSIKAPETRLEALLTIPQESQSIVGTGQIPASCHVVSATGAPTIRTVSSSSKNQKTLVNQYTVQMNVRLMGRQSATANGYRVKPRHSED